MADFYYDESRVSSGSAGIEGDVLRIEDDDELFDGNDDQTRSGTERTGLSGEKIGASGSPDWSGDDDETSTDGLLDIETIEDNLSNLGRSADGTQQVYLHLSIPGYSLNDISLLQDYNQLQKIELPYNEITDLSVFSSMPFLLELDLSHNKLKKLLDFTPPKNLKIVDVSYNDIEEIPDLSAHHYLCKLVLDNNKISQLKGLGNCHRLQILSVAHNKISTIEGLDDLPIEDLNLSFNKITKIENLKKLNILRCINLSGNNIRSMSGLANHEFLETIDLEENEIIDLVEVQHIRELSLLRNLNLQRNPIRELPDYRLSILFYIQQLTELDKRKAEVEEKVAAMNMFSPPMEVMASRDHIMHVVYSFLQPSSVLDSTLPSLETPYPMLVLVGPQGSGKADLAQKLVEEFSDYFGYGITHTTARPKITEKQGKDHHFVTVEEFEESIKMGRFLYTYSYHGELYGLTLDAVESVAREGLACVVPMEIEGVLTLKNTYFEPRYILILPMNEDNHEKRLRKQITYNETQIQLTISRRELYMTYNKDHPGFFDMMINSDDIVDAYKQLRRLVMEYLGINAASPSVSDFGPSIAGSTIEKENTTDTLGGQSNLTRQWSKLSLQDSLSQAINNLKVRSAPSPMPTTGRGIVEERSLQRRQSAAREAASGNKQTKYEQLLQQAPRTVPASTANQVGLGDEMNEYRSYSAPSGRNNMDVLPPTSPDSSIVGSGSNSSLSNISEACDMEQQNRSSPQQSPDGSVDGTLDLPTEALDMIELLSGSGSKNISGSIPLAPRPGSGQSGAYPDSNASCSRPNSRLGSDRLKVLPPIAGQ